MLLKYYLSSEYALVWMCECVCLHAAIRGYDGCTVPSSVCVFACCYIRGYDGCTVPWTLHASSESDGSAGDTDAHGGEEEALPVSASAWKSSRKSASQQAKIDDATERRKKQSLYGANVEVTDVCSATCLRGCRLDIMNACSHVFVHMVCICGNACMGKYDAGEGI